MDDEDIFPSFNLEGAIFVISSVGICVGTRDIKHPAPRFCCASTEDNNGFTSFASDVAFYMVPRIYSFMKTRDFMVRLALEVTEGPHC
eukprot:scaffold111041_cov65-Attheya_sp.AAC.3